MFNPVQESFRNIFKEKRLFFSSFLSLIIIFIILNVFVFGIFNLNKFKIKMYNSNHGIVYIKTMEEREIDNFKEKLLKMEDIQSIKYISKENALEVLEKELNVDLSEEENPLLDSFYIYLNKNIDANKLKNNLSNFSEIVEIDMKAEDINRINEFNNRLDSTIIYFGIFSLLFGIVLLANITSTNVRMKKNEIIELISQGVNTSIIKFSFFFENLIVIFITSVLGFFLFYKIQLFILNLLTMLKINLFDVPTKNELFKIYAFSLILSICIIFFSNFIGLNRYYKNKKISEKKENVKFTEKETIIEEDVVNEYEIKKEEK